jgi:hypothetical protein
VASTAQSAPRASSRVPSSRAFTWPADNTLCSRRTWAGTMRFATAAFTAISPSSTAAPSAIRSTVRACCRVRGESPRWSMSASTNTL